MTETAQESAPHSVPPKNKKLGGTALRLASALPLVPLVIYLLFFGPTIAFQVTALIVGAIAAHEMMAMNMPGKVVPQIWGVLASTGLMASILFDTQYLLLCIAIIMLGNLVLSVAFPHPIEKASRRMGAMGMGPLYVGGLLGLTASTYSEHQGWWLLLAMFMAFLSDTGAYFAGRALGKHKLYPALSPKKTVEGSIGGIVAATIGAVCLSIWLIPDFPVWHAIVLTVVGTAIGQTGDLFASLIKRSTGVKDSGKIMPGHGGLLDRIDALLFTGTTVWVYLNYINPT